MKRYRSGSETVGRCGVLLFCVKSGKSSLNVNLRIFLIFNFLERQVDSIWKEDCIAYQK